MPNGTNFFRLGGVDEVQEFIRVTVGWFLLLHYSLESCRLGQFISLKGPSTAQTTSFYVLVIIDNHRLWG